MFVKHSRRRRNKFTIQVYRYCRSKFAHMANVMLTSNEASTVFKGIKQKKNKMVVHHEAVASVQDAHIGTLIVKTPLRLVICCASVVLCVEMYVMRVHYIKNTSHIQKTLLR